MTLSKFLDPKNDVAFRKIFGTEANKDILIHFINDILEFKDNNKIEDVTYLATIQNPEISYAKESVVDVLCRDKNGREIIVEMQVSPEKGFEKRAQYYASKAYGKQLRHGKEEQGLYHNLKEVIFIVISNYTMFKNKKSFKSDHVILDKKTYENDLKDFSFTFIELPKFKKKRIDELETIIDKWCYFFKYADETSESDLEKIIGSDEVIERAYDALNQFNWTEIELNTYEKEQKRIMDNRAAEAYLVDKGREQGLVEGKKSGLAEGEVQGIKKTAINMLKQKLDVKLIIEVTGLGEEDILKLKNKKGIHSHMLKP